MQTAYSSKESTFYDKFDAIFKKCSSNAETISNKLLHSSEPITTAEKVGLLFTVISFGVIFSPLILSDSDPYHLKWSFDKIKETIPFIDELAKNQEIPHTLIIHLTFSSETHIEASEKVIRGEFRSLIF